MISSVMLLPFQKTAHSPRGFRQTRTLRVRLLPRRLPQSRPGLLESRLTKGHRLTADRVLNSKLNLPDSSAGLRIQLRLQQESRGSDH